MPALAELTPCAHPLLLTPRPAGLLPAGQGAEAAGRHCGRHCAAAGHRACPGAHPVSSGVSCVRARQVQRRPARRSQASCWNGIECWAGGAGSQAGSCRRRAEQPDVEQLSATVPARSGWHNVPRWLGQLGAAASTTAASGPSAAAMAPATPAAVPAARWSMQKGFVPLPKSNNPERQQSNLDVFRQALAHCMGTAAVCCFRTRSGSVCGGAAQGGEHAQLAASWHHSAHSCRRLAAVVEQCIDSGRAMI